MPEVGSRALLEPVQFVVSTDSQEFDVVFVNEDKDRPIVTCYVNAPAAPPLKAELVIVQERMEWIGDEKIFSLEERSLYFLVEPCKALFEMFVKRYPHCRLL
ncbi:MAG: hypothetical protein AAB855_01090 [Patescibacteria group bacterium]